jgi:hypothetical protein
MRRKKKTAEATPIFWAPSDLRLAITWLDLEIMSVEIAKVATATDTKSRVKIVSCPKTLKNWSVIIALVVANAVKAATSAKVVLDTLRLLATTRSGRIARLLFMHSLPSEHLRH